MEKFLPREPQLTNSDLDCIRASVKWQEMFSGLGLRKAKRKSKPNDWWAFSPFHDEKAPSFHMGAGGIWYDFSIGEGGGAIELVQKLRHCNCYEAGRIILDQNWATKASLTSPADNQCEQIQERVSDTTIDVLNSALKNAVIRQDLMSMTSYHPYLESRGLSETTCQDLGIGFLTQGRSPLRGRVVFQIRDARGKGKKAEQRQPVIISHMGRAVDTAQSPKYLFYEGFHKTAELYGQDIIWLGDEAAEQINSTGKIILTEGTLDLAKAYEAGLRNVVASFGASLSEEQSGKLKAMASHHNIDTIKIVFDRDETGKKGAVKAKACLESLGLNVQVFKWSQELGKRHIPIPKQIHDLADFTPKQISWLRKKNLL